MRRLNIPPGVHGPKGKAGKPTEYGVQLREKQKVKRMYGVLESQFRKYYEWASRHKGATGKILLQLLERRLDNVVYRSGFTPTRAMARQLVVHNHVLVNGKVVNRPAYQIELGQIVTLSSKAMMIPTVKILLESENQSLPEWIKKKAAASLVEQLPSRDDITDDISEQYIVEFYSR